MSDISVGDVFRDKYYDNKPSRDGLDHTKRTIRVVKLLPNGVIADVVTDTLGRAPRKPRQTTVMFKTLRAGYAPAATDAAPNRSAAPVK